MTTEEIIQTLKTAQAEVEWNYPMDYAAAIDEAIEAVYVRDELTETMKLLLLGEGITETGLRLLLENAKNRAKMEGIREDSIMKDYYYRLLMDLMSKAEIKEGGNETRNHDDR